MDIIDDNDDDENSGAEKDNGESDNGGGENDDGESDDGEKFSLKIIVRGERIIQYLNIIRIVEAQH